MGARNEGDQGWLIAEAKNSL